MMIGLSNEDLETLMIILKSKIKILKKIDFLLFISIQKIHPNFLITFML